MLLASGAAVAAAAVVLIVTCVLPVASNPPPMRGTDWTRIPRTPPNPADNETGHGDVEEVLELPMPGMQPATGKPAPHPAEAANSRLRIRLRDADSGEAVAMSGRLWRLRIPESAEWMEGDSMVREFSIPAEGALLLDLDRGAYRLELPEQRKSAGDPPEFQIGDGTEELLLEVFPPRIMRFWLVVVDEQGHRLEHAEAVLRGCSNHSTRIDRPSWAHPRIRQPVNGVHQSGGWIGVASGCGVGQSPGEAVLAESRGFPVGLLAESSRERSSSAGYIHRFADRNDVTCGIGSGVYRADTTLLAVAVPLDRLVRDIRMPGGGSVPLAGAVVTARCESVVGDPDRIREIAGTLPIEVTVSYAGFQPLAFRFRLDDDVVERRLIPE